jgi:hypothetical protein
MKLDDLKLTLENDRHFYCDWIENPDSAKFPMLRKHAKRCSHYLYLSSSECRELKEYFAARYADELNARSPPKKESAIVQSQPEEPIMFFANKSFLNGQDISKLSNAEIYSAIAAKEAEISRLEQIQNKPKSLQNEIEQAKGDIRSLVEFLDSKVARDFYPQQLP